MLCEVVIQLLTVIRVSSGKYCFSIRPSYRPFPVFFPFCPGWFGDKLGVGCDPPCVGLVSVVGNFCCYIFGFGNPLEIIKEITTTSTQD